jgi:hypothetical protein
MLLYIYIKVAKKIKMIREDRRVEREEIMEKSKDKVKKGYGKK